MAAVIVTTFVTTTAFAATVFTAAAIFTALAAAAFTTLAAALTAAIFTALAAFVAAAFTALTAATALVTDHMAASFFEDEAMRAFWNRDRDAVTTLEFIAGGACGRWSGDANATAHFIAPRAMWRWNHTAVTALKHIAGWALRTVLVEACAAATGPSDATGPSHRASGSEHEKSDGENCDQALPHEKSLVL